MPTHRNVLAAIALPALVLAAAGAAVGVATASRTSTTAATAAAAIATAASGNAAASYDLDTVHSSVTFRIRHAGVTNFYGRFNAISGGLTFNADNPAESTINLTIPVASVDTNNDKRDEHLQAADFFNARQFPDATFTGTGLRPTGETNVYEITGDLSLHGVTKPVTARVTYLGEGTFRGATVAGFEAHFEIKRTDFGITTYVADDGGESGGLGNTVHITVSLEAVKK